MAHLISGSEVSLQIQQELSHKIKSINFSRSPCLAVILVGDDPASITYVSRKQKVCQKVGIHSILHVLDQNTHQDAVEHVIQQLNTSDDVDGILLQLPLPKHLNTDFLLRLIDPKKDVDGLHPLNMGKLLLGQSDGFIPCTPLGIVTLLDRYKIKTWGKRVVIVGRSNIVGKPLAALLSQKNPEVGEGNATVTLAHSKTEELDKVCAEADILIAAIGVKNFIKKHMVKPGATVIDVGINREGNHLLGDVDFKEVVKVAEFITPVPGGVGPMTIAMLLNNTWKSFQQRVGNYE